MTHQHAGRYVLKKPVFFIGFMGAGKTSVSQQIAVTCGLASIDADEYLEFREDRIIADIFAEDGEEAFRDIETDVLRDLTRRSPRLIGCGGGVVSKRPENAQILSLIHISEPTRLLSISYAVFCLKKKNKNYKP